MLASDGADVGHARDPRDPQGGSRLHVLAGVVGLKFLDGVVLGILVFCGLLLFKHIAPQAHHAVFEQVHRAATDLTIRARADPRRFEPSALPITLVALDERDSWEDGGGGPSEALRRVIDLVGRDGANAIVLDHFFNNAAAINCTTIPNLCSTSFPPVILPVEIKRLPQPQQLHAKEAPEGAADRARADRFAFVDWDPAEGCGREPNLWYGHVYFESDVDGVQRHLAPFVWIGGASTDQASPPLPLPAVPLLAARFEELRGRGGTIAPLHAAFPLAQRCRAAGTTTTVRVGRTQLPIDASAQAQPIRYAFNGPRPGATESDLHHAFLLDNRVTYRSLPFRLVEREATALVSPTTPAAPFSGTVVVIGQASGGNDVKSTPLGAMAGPVVIANAIRSLRQYDPPGPHDTADALLELAVIAITAAVFALLFWAPVTLWRMHVSPIVAIRSERVAWLVARAVVFLLMMVLGIGWLAAAIVLTYLLIDHAVAPMFWSYVAAGGEVDFVLPAILIVLKGALEASKLCVDGLSSGSHIFWATLLPRARATLAAAFKTVEHPHE